MRGWSVDSRRVPLKDAEGHVIGYAEVFEDGRYEGHITIPFALPNDFVFRVERVWNERGL